MRKLAYAASVLVLVGVAAAIAIPNFLQFRMKAPSQEVRSNMGAVRSTEIDRSGLHSKIGPPPPRWRGPRHQPRMRGPRWRSAPPRFAADAKRVPPPSQQYVGRDRFEKITPNPVKVAAEEPVSTFSIDVDTASYAFVRRSLNEGHLPQTDAVRVEEMINYFDYDYPAPDGPRGAVPRQRSRSSRRRGTRRTKLVHIGLHGLELRPGRRPRANLVFLIDVSGSMASPDKLPLLKSAFRLLVQNLEPDDTVAIVVYAGAAGTVLEPTPARRERRSSRPSSGSRPAARPPGRRASSRPTRWRRRTSTLSGVNRVILATDGDFNVGISDPERAQGLRRAQARERRLPVGARLRQRQPQRRADADARRRTATATPPTSTRSSEARKVLVEEAAARCSRSPRT